MGYNNKAKKAFIKCQTKLFAYELYLNYKYFKQRDNPERLLNDFLSSNWYLTDKEQKKLFKDAVIIANKKYNLNIKVSSDC